jgi:hypothetical protein
MEKAMKKDAIKVKDSKKRIYKKPQIQSEKLNSYGAVCNGTTTGGRKASAISPAFCNAGRLNS